MALPTLLIHGDADASTPIDLSSRQSVTLIGSRLEVYENAGHGLYVTHRGRLSSDLLKFCMEATECNAQFQLRDAPTSRLSSALHIYGGDFIRAEKTKWCDPVLNEQPFNLFQVLGSLGTRLGPRASAFQVLHT